MLATLANLWSFLTTWFKGLFSAKVAVSAEVDVNASSTTPTTTTSTSTTTTDTTK